MSETTDLMAAHLQDGIPDFSSGSALHGAAQRIIREVAFFEGLRMADEDDLLKKELCRRYIALAEERWPELKQKAPGHL